MKPAHELIREIRASGRNGKAVPWDDIAAEVGATRKTVTSWLKPDVDIQQDHYANLVVAHKKFVKGQTGPAVDPIDRMRGEMKGWIDGMSDDGARRLYPTLLRAFKDDAVLRDPEGAIATLIAAGYNITEPGAGKEPPTDEAVVAAAAILELAKKSKPTEHQKPKVAG